MFLTLIQKIILGVYVFILLSIPVGTYLVSQYQNTQTKASEKKDTKKAVKAVPTPTTSAAKQLLDLSEESAGSSLSESSSSLDSSSPEIATSYGPTLALQVALEGRPKDNQVTKLFIGITQGSLATNPKFLLSFSVNLPASGKYSNLSLAGLNPGSSYTALIKGSTQIATSSAFTLTPTVTNLNGGELINLLSGDLNEDNIVNSADYSIAQKAAGATLQSTTWNASADLNKDGIINTFDLGIIAKNLGKVGASGAWTSPPPKTATSSASLNSPPIGGPAGSDGYWLWIPK